MRPLTGDAQVHGETVGGRGAGRLVQKTGEQMAANLRRGGEEATPVFAGSARLPSSGRDLNAGSAEARTSWSRCEAALSGSKITIAASDLGGRIAWVFNSTAGLLEDALGLTDQETFPADVGKALAAARMAALSSGAGQEIELAVPGRQGPRWYEVSVRPHRQAGRLVGTVASFIDVTDRKMQEEHLRIVLRELAHRSKNLLAVIQGIARQTAGDTSSVPQFLARLNGRIFSLSRAHDVLIDADWRGARIFDLVRSQIALYAQERMPAIIIEGENEFLRPNAAQYVGLALHELTTNALKYGALSRPDGTVAVRFEKGPDGARYCFTWKETSSAVVRKPDAPSFGITMLTHVIPTSVGGVAELSFEPQGLSYSLEIPTAQLLA